MLIFADDGAHSIDGPVKLLCDFTDGSTLGPASAEMFLLGSKLMKLSHVRRIAEMSAQLKMSEEEAIQEIEEAVIGAKLSLDRNTARLIAEQILQNLCEREVIE